jgi:hypothetical protein
MRAMDDFNTKKRDRELINSLEMRRVPEAKARAIYNTARYNHSALFITSISSSLITLITAFFLFAPPELMMKFPAPFLLVRALRIHRTWFIVICAFFALMAALNIARFRINQSYITAVRHGYPRIDKPSSQPASEQGDWGRIDAEKTAQGITLEKILAGIAKNDKPTIAITACCALFFLTMAGVCVVGAESVPLASVFLIIAAATAVFGAVSFRRSHDPQYLLREINAFCKKSSVTLGDIKADLAVSADFGKIFFGRKYIVLFSGDVLKALMPGDIASAEMHVWQSNSVGTVYFLRLHTRNGKKPVDISSDWLTVRKQLEYMSEKYPGVNVSVPEIE